MSYFRSLLCISAIFSCIQRSETVTCYADEDITANRTCEGEFCVAIRRNSVSLVIYDVHRVLTQTCIVGAKKPSATCYVGYDDEMTCFCDSDLCNTNVLFRSNFTTIPIIECKSVKRREYVAAACNKCIRKIVHFKSNDIDPSVYTNEFVDCGSSKDSSDFVFDPDGVDLPRIFENFFSDACYNISVHPEHYSVYCRCTQDNCNTPEAPNIPYPISFENTVSCHTSGMDDDYIQSKYIIDDFNTYNDLLRNESYVDEGFCRGQHCFVAVHGGFEKDLMYYKGCISANEQGENKIQLGYSYLNYMKIYICDADLCNLDVRTALEEGSNATMAVRDNADSRTDNSYWFMLSSVLLIVCLF